MPDSVNIGRNAERVTTSPILDPISGVRMIVDDETEIVKGDSTGYVLEIESPFATEAQTQWLLSKLKGIEYQPYTADKAMLNPAAEIGDYITTYGVFGGIFSENIKFGSISAADVSAPQDSSIDHEYPYKTPSDRKFIRKMKEIAAEFEIQAGEISAKVSQIGGDSQSFGWSITTAGMYWYANGLEIMRATQAGLKVTGEINATSGNIGGATIVNGTLTVNNANIGSINGTKIIANTMPGSRIADDSIGSTKYGTGSVHGGSNGAIASGTVAYGNTSFTGTLDQVGVNKSNIEAINGYFTGTANFNYAIVSVLQAQAVTLGGHPLYYSDGYVRYSQ